MTRPTTTGKAQDLITFTRSTTGTALAKISYGEELVTNGTFDDGTTGWSGDGATILSAADNKLSVTNGDNTPAYALQYIDTVIGERYTFTADLISTSGSLARMLVSGGVIDTGATLSAGAQTITWTATLTSHAIFVANGDNSSAGDVVKWSNLSVKEVLYDQPDGTLQLFNHPINKPRIEYDASGNCLGLLVEEARTNKVAYSQDFTQSYWTKNELTVAPAPVAAPDGTMTATHAVKAGSNAYLIRLSTASTADRHSIWARTVSGTGTMYIAGTRPDALVTVTEEWQRLDVQSSNTNVYAASLRGDATLTEVYIWGSQVETGTFPTSYIPTSGSTVTRAADVASLAVSEFGYNQDQGSVVIERRFLSNNVNANSGTDLFEDNSNKISLRKAAYLINVNGAGQVNSGYGSPIDYVSFHKIGLAFKPNSVIASTSGGLSEEDTSALIPDAVNTIQLNRVDTNASFHINGHIKSIQYYPLRLSNAQLQALTV